jgi:hypothetical protein
MPPHRRQADETIPKLTSGRQLSAALRRARDRGRGVPRSVHDEGCAADHERGGADYAARQT